MVTRPSALLAVLIVCAFCGAADMCITLFNARPMNIAERVAFVGLTGVLGLFVITDAGSVLLTHAFVASVACLVHATCKSPPSDPL
jgi:ribose/xylose/arabinose/galactoside ABC-type transport system permease subunit